MQDSKQPLSLFDELLSLQEMAKDIDIPEEFLIKRNSQRQDEPKPTQTQTSLPATTTTTKRNSRSTAFFQDSEQRDRVRKFLRDNTPKGARGLIQPLLDSGKCTKADLNAHVGPNGETPLYLAAANGNTEIIPLLIESGANVDQTCMNGETPLHAAVRNKKTETIQALLNKGASVTIRNSSNETAIEIAIRENNLSAIRILLADKSKISDRDQNRILQLAAHLGNTAVLSYFASLENKQYILSKDPITGETPLHTAIKYGHVNFATALIKMAELGQYLEDILYSHKLGQTPLHFACQYNQPAIVKILLAYNEKYSEKNEHLSETRDFNLCTPICYAILGHYLEIIDLLWPISNLDKLATVSTVNENLSKTTEQLKIYNLKDKLHGETLLHIFIRLKSLDDIKKLLEYKPDISIANVRGETPLHYAVLLEDLEVLQALLKANRNGVLITRQLEHAAKAKDKHGHTPMVTAMLHKNKEVLLTLISSGIKPEDDPSILNVLSKTADFLTIKWVIEEFYLGRLDGADKVHDEYNLAWFLIQQDENGDTPLHHAARRGDVDLLAYFISILKKKGKDHFVTLSSLTNDKGELPIHSALVARQYNAANYLFDNADISKEVTQANVINFKNRPLMFFAAKHGCREIVEKILTANRAQEQSKLAEKDSNGLSLLHYAIMGNNLVLIKYLVLEKKMKLEKDKSGKTVFHYIFMYGRYIDILEFFLSQFVSSSTKDSFLDYLNLTDSDGKTAIEYAVSNTGLMLLKHITSHHQLSAVDLADKAVIKQNFCQLLPLIRIDPNLIMRKYTGEKTVFHIAAENGLTDLLIELHKLVKTVLKTDDSLGIFTLPDAEGNSPLASAYQYFNQATLEDKDKMGEFILSIFGISLDNIAEVNEDRQTHLHQIILKNQFSHILIPVFIHQLKRYYKDTTAENLDNNNNNNDSLSAKDKMKAFLSTKDKYGETALHYFIMNMKLTTPDDIDNPNSNFSLFNRLKALGFDLNVQNAAGYTLLHFAVLKKQEQIALYLINSKAAPTHKKDNKGKLPLHIAAQQGLKNTMRSILSLYPKQINEKDDAGNTPLYYALQIAATNSRSYTLEAELTELYQDIVKLLLAYKIDFTDHVESYFSLIVQLGSPEIYKIAINQLPSTTALSDELKNKLLLIATERLIETHQAHQTENRRNSSFLATFDNEHSSKVTRTTERNLAWKLNTDHAKEQAELKAKHTKKEEKFRAKEQGYIAIIQQLIETGADLQHQNMSGKSARDLLEEHQLSSNIRDINNNNMPTYS